MDKQVLRPGDRAADAGASPVAGAACQLWGSGTRLARTVIGRPHTAISGGHRDLFCVSAQPEDTRKPSRGAAPEPRVLPPSDPLTWQPPLFWNFREARTSQRPTSPQSQAPCRGGSGLPPRSQGPERTPHCDGDPGGQVAGTQGPGRGLVRASPPLGSGRGRVHGPEAWRPEDSASPATQRTVPSFTGR